MSEESSLFNPGFLGAGGFHWWVGQVADDSTWRGNISDKKFEGTGKIPGWGYRYKVRIIGLHDKEEETLTSDQLPWAQVMYPITAGGGQAGAHQTPNIRQGMFVFGFFLDGQDQENPVIMGVLGNNAQTKLATEIGTTKQNFSATSGYAKGTNPDPKLKIADQNIDTAAKPTENTTAVHKQTTANVKLNDLYTSFTIPLSSPCKKDNTDISNIKTVIENLTNEINKIQQAIASPIDAASKALGDIKKSIEGATQQIAAGIKSVMDKVRGYVLKQINKLTDKLADMMFPNIRFKFLDLKKLATGKLACLFNKLINGLPGIIGAFLNSSFGKYSDKPQTEEEMMVPPGAPTVGVGVTVTFQDVLNIPFENRPVEAYETRQPQRKPIPICSVEALIGNVVGNILPELTQGIDDAIVPINTFVSNYIEEIAQLGGGIDAVEKSGALNTQASSITSSATSGPDTTATNKKSSGSAINQVNDSINSAIGLGGQAAGIAGQAIGTGTAVIGALQAGDPLAAANVIGGAIGGQAGAVIGQATSIAGQAIGVANALQTGGVLDAASALGTVLGGPTGSLIGGLVGDISAAFGFINGILNFFSCDDAPKCPQSNGYRFHDGSIGSGQVDIANLVNAGKACAAPPTVPQPPTVPFAAPTSSIQGAIGAVTAAGTVIERVAGVANPVTTVVKTATNALEIFNK